MIFFLVKDRGETDLAYVKSHVNAHALEGGTVDGEKKKLLAWNEVYDSVEALKTAVIAAAKQDPVCKGYCAASEREFGINPLKEEVKDGLSKTQHEKILGSVFKTWPHPLIGNIWNSPRARRADMALQVQVNWQRASSGWIDATTIDKIKALQAMMGDLSGKTGARDQVRICSNIVELARAIIGYITCDAAKRLEKLIALELCQSPGLLARQRALIKSYTDANDDKFSSDKFKDVIRKGEYASYFMNLTPFYEEKGGLKPELDTLANDDTFCRRVFSMALEDIDLSEVRIEGKLDGKSASDIALHLWSELPPQVRCGVLINDIRKLHGPVGSLAKVGMHFADTDKDLDTCRIGDGCNISSSSGNDFAPSISVKGKTNSFVWSWNRDERFHGTITYRHHLCPLWGGSSGHTGGGLSFWLARGNCTGSARKTLPTTVAYSLFLVWRLYYDKRLSPVHTMTETFEATLEKTILDEPYTYNAPMSYDLSSIEGTDILPFLDKVAIVNTKTKLDALNPIDVLRMTKQRLYGALDDEDLDHGEAYTGLGGHLTTARSAIAKDYWLPRWAKELEFAPPSTSKTQVARRRLNVIMKYLPTLELKPEPGTAVRTGATPPPQRDPAPQDTVRGGGGDDTVRGGGGGGRNRGGGGGGGRNRGGGGGGGRNRGGGGGGGRNRGGGGGGGRNRGGGGGGGRNRGGGGGGGGGNGGTRK